MTNDADSTTPTPSAARHMTDSEKKNWAVAAHLSALVAFAGIPSLIGPLVVWLAKKDQDAYVAAHAVHALNFNISVLIYTTVAVGATAVIGVATLGIGLLLAIPALIVAFIIWLVLVILGSVAASRGEQYRYPMTIGFLS